MTIRNAFTACAALGLVISGLACGPGDGDDGGEDATGDATARPDPARVAEELRPRVHIVGRPDSAFSVRERMARYGVPGVAVAVIDDHRVAWAAGFGSREAGGGTPVDTLTRFLAGSISKPVFATGALALVERGVLSLDADVNDALTSWKIPESRFTADRPVTLRQLLSHTAGLTVHGFPGYDVGAEIPSVPEILDGEGPANTDPVRNDTFPGAGFDYSGGGYTVAQLAATDAAGEPFPELMRRLVLEPAGMPHSTFRNPPTGEADRHAATGHEEPNTPVEGRYHVYPEMAAAGLWTTAPDLARWAIDVSRSYLGEGGVLSRETAREMLSRQVELPDGQLVQEQAWGLGPALAGNGDSLRFSHGGRDEGFLALAAMWPVPGQGLVVLTNGTSNALMAEISRAFSHVYGLPLRSRIEKRVAPADSVTLAGLEGRYELTGPASGLAAEVRRTGDTLRMEVPGWLSGRLYPEAGKRDVFFERATGSEWRFVRSGDDRAAPATRLEVVRPGSDEPLVAERVDPGR